MQKFLLAIVLFLPTILKAELRVDITQGTIAPTPIAIVKFLPADSSNPELGADIANVLAADLQGSGFFKLINPAAFIQSAQDAIVAPRFADWRVINAQVLVVGNYRQAEGDKLRVEFKLFDVITQKQIEGLAFTVSPKDLRRVSHKIADAVYKRVNSEEGYFDTRVVYIEEHGAGKNKVTRLAVMDQDGANHKYLTDHKHLIMTPRFSPNLQHIALMDYGQDRKTPRVYIMDTRTGQRRLLGNFKSMTFAPRFCPDGSNILFSSMRNGNSDIYMMNMANGATRKLTDGPMIDTSPSMSPDGRQIVFNSDRGGTQQLYVMNADGSNVRRISYGNGKYASPAWSPRGDLIAFTKMYQGRFYIGVMKPDGSGERLIAADFAVEDPSWSPNGSFVMYTKSSGGGRSGVYAVHISGNFERRIPTPPNTQSVTASWSPLLP